MRYVFASNVTNKIQKTDQMVYECNIFERLDEQLISANI